ncbi:MAG TPA: cytochrome-c peroxidase, partial [Blastocatellia bacterium]
MRRYFIFGFFLLGIPAAFLWHRGLHARDSTIIPVVDSSVCQGPAEPIQPIPREVHLDSAKVNLGYALFNDPRLSHDGTVSCSTCHALTTGGCDRPQTSVGINGQIGSVNAPTVFNSGANFRQFWDRRATTLEDQIDGPIQASHEMGSSWPEVVTKLSDSPAYVVSFSAIYGDGIKARSVKDAIATFECSLITPDSGFDQYLR